MRRGMQTEPKIKPLDECAHYVSLNGEHTGYEILQCASPGVITSTKFTDALCQTAETNPQNPNV